MLDLVARAGAVETGQVWRCDESQVDPADVPEPHDIPLWEPHPRFDVVVDRVEEDYVELTVATGNSHPRTPDIGAEMVSTTETLTSDPRWSLRDEVADAE